MARATSKDSGAFRTIGELSEEIGVAQHILRYWETKFPQLTPLKRAGNRRYYRPADVETARAIDRLVNREGYTLKGAQKALRTLSDEPDAANHAPTAPVDHADAPAPAVDVAALRALRNRIAAALEA
ncbi:MerR family transcriptional regulator [Sphingomicrobium sp. XHP0239]|uniref:MerR family transcriptional regulator n=1 Tax=Sphingomicrobium maritimum TaxID=3133972 RepID=UPI0031CC40FF